MSNSLYMTTEEAARVLGFSVRLITKWLNAYEESGGAEGMPGGVRFGRNWRIHRETFNSWVTTKKCG